MKPKVLIRADGSHQIGLGHLTRCTALAHMLKDKFAVTFYCRLVPDQVVMEQAAIGLKCISIADDNEFLTKTGSNCIVVLDGYHYNIEYQKQIRSKGARLVCIDDLHDQEFAADLIINHAPGIGPYDYKAQPYTQFALGLDYTLLRPAFLEQAKRKRVIRNVGTVLICFGGTDHKNLTQSTLNMVLELPQFKKIIVVTGPTYQITDSFRQLVVCDDRIDHRQALNEQQMLDTMLESDLAIVPASGILFEVLAAGCVAISGIYIDNQKFVYENFRNSGQIIDSGNFENTQLHNAISLALNQDTSKTSGIDGRSASRILKLFDQMEKEFLVSLRKAVAGDLDLSFGWATDPEIRRYSFRQHQITKQEHSEWFLNKISDAGCHYFIVEYEGTPVGSIRFDIKEGEAVISFLLDPAYHGRGLGQIILKQGIEWLGMENCEDLTPVRVISGEVLIANIPSVRAFERLGFIKTDHADHFKFEKWVS
jgi:UDP-2,4-diacetamido-2,4,6-trideoxy-beta-L-altropyranose hydrolase